MKRAFDLALLLIVSPFAIPLCIVIAALVRWRLGAPVFFKQQRPGLNAQPFELIKFRTMTDARGADAKLLPDAERLPRFGKFLRASSLDELPELLNILRGEMSFVGPRPLLMQYLPLYSPQQARRHEVRPGITGWAQVNGRNSLSWEEKFVLDQWYVANQSLWLDCRILGLTAHRVFKSEGISAQGEATMAPFLGSGNHADLPSETDTP